MINDMRKYRQKTIKNKQTRIKINDRSLFHPADLSTFSPLTLSSLISANKFRPTVFLCVFDVRNGKQCKILHDFKILAIQPYA